MGIDFKLIIIILSILVYFTKLRFKDIVIIIKMRIPMQMRYFKAYLYDTDYFTILVLFSQLRFYG